MQYQLAAKATVKMANNTEQMARLIVLSVTGLVFIGISVGCAQIHIDSFIFGGCYFITIWAIPAVKFFNGLHQRNDKDLLSWIAIAFIHEILLLVWSISHIRERISRTHSSSAGTIHTDFVIACSIVSSLPVMIIVILVPSYVYINMGKTLTDESLHAEILRKTLMKK